MRALAFAVLLASTSASAESLGDAELRLGYGVALDGGAEMTSARSSPLTITARAAIAVSNSPVMAAYGGLVVETLDRSTVGAQGGIKLTPNHGPIRITAGGEWIFAPATMWGATASGGYCHHVGTDVAICGDVELTAFFAGTGLPNDKTVTQVQAVLGIMYDGF